MWTCLKCGRSFKRQDQDHFCGKAPDTIKAYIAEQPETVRPILNQVRDTIRQALPEASEKISWQMPTFWKKTNIIHFAAFKNHVGIFPGSEAMVHFADRLTEYKTSKGAWQLPYDKPLPLELIAEMAKLCYETGNHH